LEAKIATAEVVHIDASLIRANVSWESLVERHVEMYWVRTGPRNYRVGKVRSIVLIGHATAWPLERSRACLVSC
jgi:hypothetical protein